MELSGTGKIGIAILRRVNSETNDYSRQIFLTRLAPK